MEEVASLLARAVRARHADAELGPVAPSLHELRVRYGGDDGPDLDAVASELGLRAADVVELHASPEYEVLFLGFAPGFAYLGEVHARLVVPRLATPRVRVPAGSVAIAGSMTAVYPQPSPGGWRILGRTDERLFDPAAVAAGTAPPGRPRPLHSRLMAGTEVLEVVGPGLLTTVQDARPAGPRSRGDHAGRRSGYAGRWPSPTRSSETRPMPRRSS